MTNLFTTMNANVNQTEGTPIKYNEFLKEFIMNYVLGKDLIRNINKNVLIDIQGIGSNEVKEILLDLIEEEKGIYDFSKDKLDIFDYSIRLIKKFKLAKFEDENMKVLFKFIIIATFKIILKYVKTLIVNYYDEDSGPDFIAYFNTYFTILLDDGYEFFEKYGSHLENVNCSSVRLSFNRHPKEVLLLRRKLGEFVKLPSTDSYDKVVNLKIYEDDFVKLDKDFFAILILKSILKK